MPTSKRQVYVLCDIEGASGISLANKGAMVHGSADWKQYGRSLITSDVQAVCTAINEFGIDEIIINDAHDNMKRTPNVLPDELPSNVRILRRPSLPGKPGRVIRDEPFGMVIVGQHAMAGGGGLTPHTIAWPFAEIIINDLRVGEIGIELASFMGTRLLAVIGEQAAINEAHALCPTCVGVPVKSLESGWFPSAEEMHPIIREKTLEALQHREEMTGLHLKAPFRFEMRPHESLFLNRDKRFFLRTLMRYIVFNRCKGTMTENAVTWETNTIIGGLYLLQASRGFMQKRMAETNAGVPS